MFIFPAKKAVTITRARPRTSTCITSNGGFKTGPSTTILTFKARGFFKERRVAARIKKSCGAHAANAGASIQGEKKKKKNEIHSPLAHIYRWVARYKKIANICVHSTSYFFMSIYTRLYVREGRGRANLAQSLSSTLPGPHARTQLFPISCRCKHEIRTSHQSWRERECKKQRRKADAERGSWKLELLYV